MVIVCPQLVKSSPVLGLFVFGSHSTLSNFSTLIEIIQVVVMDRFCYMCNQLFLKIFIF